MANSIFRFCFVTGKAVISKRISHFTFNVNLNTLDCRHYSSKMQLGAQVPQTKDFLFRQVLLRFFGVGIVKISFVFESDGFFINIYEQELILYYVRL